MASRSTRSPLLPKRSSRKNLRSMYVSKERPPSLNSMRISISFSSRSSPRANDPKTPIRRTPRLLIRSRCSASAPRMPSAVRLAPGGARAPVLEDLRSFRTPLRGASFLPDHRAYPIILLSPADQDNAFPPGCRPQGGGGGAGEGARRVSDHTLSSSTMPSGGQNNGDMSARGPLAKLYFHFHHAHGSRLNNRLPTIPV